jgi:RimJ/RimL family protein N-acetyltransferase
MYINNSIVALHNEGNMMLVRQINKSELEKYEAHLLRLENTAKFTRFLGHVGEESIHAYVEKISLGYKEAVIGLFNSDLEIVGSAHVMFLNGTTVEIALSLEKEYRGNRYGQRLFEKGVRWAKIRNAQKLYSTCFSHNSPMVALAKGNGMVLDIDGSESSAILDLNNDYNLYLLFNEAYEEHMVFMSHIFQGLLKGELLLP